MTRQQGPGLHLPDGGKIQAAVEFVLPDRTIKPVDPADQVSWNQDHICVFSPAGRDYPTGRVRCHFPLRCSQAACSHLPKYDEAAPSRSKPWKNRPNGYSAWPPYPNASNATAWASTK